ERTETRLDRWIFSNLGAPPEELLEAQQKLVKRPIFHSLQEAADALKAANNLENMPLSIRTAATMILTGIATVGLRQIPLPSRLRNFGTFTTRTMRLNGHRNLVFRFLMIVFRQRLKIKKPANQHSLPGTAKSAR